MQIIDFEERPWGFYEVLLELPETKVKQITVDNGHRLSYQYHEHRDETWVVVAGKAKVTLDGKNTIVEPGQTIQITRGVKHRVEAIGKEDLTFIEVQTGDYFGEDDIIRLEDDYERAELEHLRDGNYIGGLTMPIKNTNKLNKDE